MELKLSLVKEKSITEWCMPQSYGLYEVREKTQIYKYLSQPSLDLLSFLELNNDFIYC